MYYIDPVVKCRLLLLGTQQNMSHDSSTKGGHSYNDDHAENDRQDRQCVKHEISNKTSLNLIQMNPAGIVNSRIKQIH